MPVSEPILSLRGKAVAFTFVSAVLPPARPSLRERLADVVSRLEASPAGEDALMLAAPLEIAKLGHVADTITQTPALIACRLRRRQLLTASVRCLPGRLLARDVAWAAHTPPQGGTAMGKGKKDSKDKGKKGK